MKSIREQIVEYLENEKDLSNWINLSNMNNEEKKEEDEKNVGEIQS